MEIPAKYPSCGLFIPGLCVDNKNDEIPYPFLHRHVPVRYHVNRIPFRRTEAVCGGFRGQLERHILHGSDPAPAGQGGLPRHCPGVLQLRGYRGTHRYASALRTGAAEGQHGKLLGGIPD